MWCVYVCVITLGPGPPFEEDGPVGPVTPRSPGGPGGPRPPGGPGRPRLQKNLAACG